jgi:hypothetical protein
MSMGGSPSITGLLFDTRLADLDVAWQERKGEADALLAATHDTMAITLRLYALEIRLKTLICRRLNLEYLPRHCKTHDLMDLIIFTCFLSELEDPSKSDLRRNWDELVRYVKDSLNDLRYRPRGHLSVAVRDKLLNALDDSNHGVWTWLSSHP